MRHTGLVEKGWGYEQIWVTTDKYCMKEMVFTQKGNKFSMHFHKDKEETWLVTRGSFLLRYIDTRDAQICEIKLIPERVWTNYPLVPHQLIALEDDSRIVEVSTPDSVEDNYRVFPGDSQK